MTKLVLLFASFAFVAFLSSSSGGTVQSRGTVEATSTNDDSAATNDDSAAFTCGLACRLAGGDCCGNLCC